MSTTKVKEVAIKPLTPYPAIADELNQMVKDYKDTLVTEETFDEAKKVRGIIREKRYTLQNIAKENASIISNAGKVNKALAEELISIIRPTEDRIDGDIKKIEDKKAEEKAERDRQKAERKAELVERASKIKTDVLEKLANGISLEDAQKLLREYQDIEISEDEYEDLIFVAEQSYEEALELITGKIESLTLERAEYQEKVKKEFEEWCVTYDFEPEDLPKMEAMIKEAQEESRKVLQESRERKEKEEKEAREMEEARHSYKQYFELDPPENASPVELFGLIQEDMESKERKADEERQEKLKSDKATLEKYFNHVSCEKDIDINLENEEIAKLHQSFINNLDEMIGEFRTTLENL